MSGWLIDTLIYTGLLIALVLLLRRPVGRTFGPQLAYCLWALPFLRLLLPPIVLPASFRPEVDAAPIAAPMVPDVQWVDYVPPVDVVTVPDTVTAVAPSAPVALVWEWPTLGESALALWLGGAVIFLAWRIVMYRKMRREVLADARPVGEIGTIRLVETPMIAAPVAFGVLDKVIALPPLFMAQPDLPARDLAIEHELSHHRANDLLANFAAQALLAMHWFNPLAWLGWRAMRRDQEAACDARVLNGRGREERVLYAALIADIAAGPRLALAAPMACPVLGERSIVHRLRSLSMGDISERRRWVGRGLIATSALALPLTASFSYAVGAQEPEPPLPPEAPAGVEPPAPPVPPEAPAAPNAPLPPEAPQAGQGQVQQFELRREGPDGKPQVQQFTLRRGPGAQGDLPPMPQVPRMEFHAQGNPTDPDFGAKMEAWGKEMEKWGEEWGEKYAAQMEKQAEQWAEAGRRAEPEVVQSCDPSERRRSTTSDGRQRIVICERDYQMAAATGLRQARASIARNSQISEEVRREVLDDLDDEIRRIESERD
ncbi:MAG: antirepressor regulating drug resistance protein [Porphyrobacter sp.]|nr:antirepressor regulating drug resistance protein [Porphyrobacter sp.]